MKYQEVNTPKKLKEGQLRVWHKPQLPIHSFYVYVASIEEAGLILETLAVYDLFQLEYQIKPDYSNVQGLDVYEDGEWVEWMDDDGDDIDSTELLQENKDE